MDLQLMMWLVIEGVLFLLTLPINRKIISQREIKIGNRQLDYRHRFIDTILEFGFNIPMCLIVTLISFMIIVKLSPDTIKIILLSCNLIVGSCLSFALTWVMKNRNMQGMFWYAVEFIIVIVLGAFGGVLDKEEVLDVYYYIIVGLISLLIAVLIIILWNALSIFPKRIKIEKNIRTDLYYRTTNITVNNSEIELVRHCEQFFDGYRNIVKKNKKVRKVEFVTLIGKCHEDWFNIIQYHMKNFIKLNIVIIIARLICNFNFCNILTVVLIICFIVNVNYLKKNDFMCLYRIAIRQFYCDWGFYIDCSDNTYKYMGDMSFLKVGKYWKWIHSFLDIVAFGRAIMTHDKYEKTCRIKILSNNFAELFSDYGKTMDKEKKWTTLLPLWALSWFEYDVCGEIGGKTRKVLRNTLSTKEEWVEVSMFLQSFHVYITRKELNKDGYKLLCGYVEKLREE